MLFLGYVLLAKGILNNHRKVDKINSWPIPKIMKSECLLRASLLLSVIDRLFLWKRPGVCKKTLVWWEKKKLQIPGCRANQI